MVFNLTRGEYLANHPRTALAFRDRLCGMIGRNFTADMDAMIFPRCNAVHTFFMRGRIDVVFLDGNGEVVALSRNLRPWQPCVGCRKAVTVIELPPGRIDASRTEVGDRINLNTNLTPETIAKLQYQGILNKG